MTKITSKRLVVLALGESTHTHIMEADMEIEYEQASDESIEFLLSGTGVVTHEEHDRLILPPGRYHKTNQVEFNPFDRTISRVWD